MQILDRLGLSTPIIQAPMAGISTPLLAAAVSNAGALGSIAVGAMDADMAARSIGEIRALTARAWNINVFAHAPAQSDPEREADWLAALSPEFARFGAEPHDRLSEIYRSFVEDDAMLAALVAAAPPVVSLHFGLPAPERMSALKQAGSLILATVTNLPEAMAAKSAGVDAVVAQGYEAGGHRGMFDPDAPDTQLGTADLTRLLVAQSGLPVIAAGGIMDGAGIAAMLDLGAVACQLGTAFIACPESAADAAYRQALASEAARQTVMTRAISGRPARCLANRFTTWGEGQALPVPAYPRAYDAGKALNAAARTKGETGYGAQWAGTGAARHRPMPAAELVAVLSAELEAMSENRET